MPPRVAYWLSSFEPAMEAVASEAAVLRRELPGSIAWGLSHRHWLLLSRKRGCCVHPRLHLLFRAATRILEPAFDLNHIFGSLDDWFYLAGARRNPTVLTLATWSSNPDRSLIDRVARFVAEDPLSREQLRRLGVDDERIDLIYPPVDLRRFTPAAPPDGPFTVLFASSPDRESWLEARGVRLLIDAAALRPHIHFRFLWRPWGDALPRVREWISERGLANVEVVTRRESDMAAAYRAAHVVAAPFLDQSRCKPSPNSLLEGLASGRPAIATRIVGVSPLLEESAAGEVCEPNADSVAAALDRLSVDWPAYSSQARRLAEQLLGLDRFLESYRRIYDELTQRANQPRQPARETATVLATPTPSS